MQPLSFSTTPRQDACRLKLSKIAFSRTAGHKRGEKSKIFNFYQMQDCTDRSGSGLLICKS